jgi:1-acyl-sn-glycerol-3-phosphate acyltransferase
MTSQADDPKPVAEIWRPDLVTLPRLTLPRRVFRVMLHIAARLAVRFITHATFKGLENLPTHGPALLVFNHLGDADAPVILAALRSPAEAIGKIELHNDGWVGMVGRAYGVIWVHRGSPDRKAIRAALEGLNEGRIIAMAPEARESLTGVLEEGTEGAAFLAVRSGAPIVPIALTGTENKFIFERKWFQRAPITVTVGKPFKIQEQAERADMIREGTRQIMEEIARLLPKEYRGKYDYVSSG